jgi:hypothetical protein
MWLYALSCLSPLYVQLIIDTLGSYADQTGLNLSNNTLTHLVLSLTIYNFMAAD